MKLNLKNPIIFFDLETTGINIASDRIVEISYLKIDLNGNEFSKTLRINPGMPIPEKAKEIHGITDEDVKNSPAFNAVAKSIAKDFEGCDLAGYNSTKFDIPLLAEEFLRAGVDIDLKKRKFVDVQVIFMKMEQRTLAAALEFYCGKSLVLCVVVMDSDSLKKGNKRFETVKKWMPKPKFRTYPRCVPD